VPKKKIPKALKQKVNKRANNLCEYCLANSLFSWHPFPIDHVLPESKGGKDLFENLANTCQNCNGGKYNKIKAYDPISKLLVPLFNPRTQEWSTHFQWNEESTHILGITPVGRATVVALKMNRVNVVNQRKALILYGVHPPTGKSYTDIK